MNIWKELFFNLLEEVEQIQHPIAQELWSDYLEIIEGMKDKGDIDY